ncbi:MAG: hypothetical protein PHU69_13535 [Fermentimonas sp.]|nr:hypothetical protein [Fermentimonas sp.]
MDYTIFTPFLDSSFAIVVAVYLLYERSTTNGKIITALQEITHCISEIKEDIIEIRRG